ncbi:alpha/beta hydrolase [Sinorhizobium sp. 7-81]|uniref:alpha/beta fold hydrolase n=1 Tax=Sinorhizobium sp. 8-89 TaxID=3049089 RepID=UPI0024C39399|nr:alpha/beta hydrolase [Sinorhizobium sp. 8-89]MDK1488903.1 alpha/beta hydrolase [Sinorhizobium sp. 8-89]
MAALCSPSCRDCLHRSAIRLRAVHGKCYGEGVEIEGRDPCASSASDDAAFDARRSGEDVTVNNLVIDHLWGEVFRDIDIRQGLDRLKMPIMLALGRFDFLVAPASTWDEYRADVSDLTIRLFEKSGHTPQLEESAAFDDALLEFLLRR